MSSRRNVEGSSRGVSPARRAAFQVLRGIEDRRGEPAALLHHPRHRSLSSADRGLATEIVLGVLRWRGSLDFVLAHHCERPLASLDPALLRSLRIGLYQLRHLDRVPSRAAVDESVRLAQDFGASRGAGLVNAVLRSVLRQPGRPEFPRRDDDPLRYLETTLSHPAWLAQRYLGRCGIDGAEARCRIQNQPPPIHVRVSSQRTVQEVRETLAGEGIVTELLPAVPRCLRVVSGSVSASRLCREGVVFPQDAGSQLVPLLVAPRSFDRVLDVCAAPGGKATAMSELAPLGAVVAVDRRPRRVQLLRELASRLGARNVSPVVADGAELPFNVTFDRVLVDVPCTSLGTLRRNPDIKWRVAEDDLARLSRLQLEILRSAARLLARGGRLVYATCSTEPEENELVVERFLAESPEFHGVHAAPSLPESAGHLVGEDGALRTLPERDDMDGYYAVILTRRESG